MATIHTPVKGFTGLVAGVPFVDGAGESEDSSALAYFDRHGYTINHNPGKPQPPVDPDSGSGDDNDNRLDRPAGNASLEAWQAYAAQEGHDVTDLKQSDIRALFSE